MTGQAENASKIDPKLEPGWRQALDAEFNKGYFHDLKIFLKSEKANGSVIFPPGPMIFSAFDFTQFDKVKVVILGQDPYHGNGQAHGLSFSVPKGIAQPPSLQNIFKEINNDLGLPIPAKKGDLTYWAQQGVFLLNAILTVQANLAASHQKKGWEEFTDAIIKTLSDQKQGLVFLLWGKFAQSKEKLIDTAKHHIIKSAHPSPFSAYSGFFGSKPFSKTNAILKSQGMEPIDWMIA
jgi:uracil-DNA glycosylase